MLARVLGVESESLDEGVVTELVASAAVEHQHLEYKAQLPGQAPDARREFARDVAAMANGGGGVMIIGIADDVNDAAKSITPVGFGPEVTRLRQICTSLIEPLLTMNLHEIPVGGSPTGVIVLEVPISQRRPYAVMEAARLGYYVRTGRSRHPMSEAEVARMYGSRFQRVQSATDRVLELVDRADSRFPERQTPAVYLAICPLETYERLFRPDRSTLGSIRSLRVPPVFGTEGVGTVLPTDLRPGFKRIDLARGYEPIVVERYGWMEFHDDCGLLAVIPGDHQLQRGLGDLTGPRLLVHPL